MKEGGLCGFDYKLKPEKDSKQARSYLRNILKEQGHQLDEGLVLNSFEMLDMIIKNIHLVDIEVRNLRKAKKAFLREHENRSQLIMDSIDGFYGTQRKNK